MVDTRNTRDGCLEIGIHPDVSLNSYAVKASLSRTDINDYDEIVGAVTTTHSHTHSCTVDSDGNGTTTTTIVLSGSVSSHTHTITDYVALSSGTPAHTHNLRCVGIVKLNPVANPTVNIAINGYVVYDPTNALPYTGGTYTGTSPYPTTFTEGNRMMFATLYVNSPILNRELVLTMETANNYTTLDVTETDRGISVLVNASFSQYSVEISPGEWIVIPAQVVPDGHSYHI